MKRIILAVLLILAVAVSAYAGTIRKNGINQGDLYELLSDLVTLVNELKTDHNALVVTNRAAFGAYSTTVKGLNITTGNASLTQ